MIQLPICQMGRLLLLFRGNACDDYHKAPKDLNSYSFRTLFVSWYTYIVIETEESKVSVHPTQGTLGTPPPDDH